MPVLVTWVLAEQIRVFVREIEAPAQLSP